MKDGVRLRCQLEEKSVSAALALGFCTQLVVQPVTAYKCQASPSSPVSFSASREVGRRPLLLLLFSFSLFVPHHDEDLPPDRGSEFVLVGKCEARGRAGR